YVQSAFLFFFQAEDGIRDRNVTGVQTCALPIWAAQKSPVKMYPALQNSGKWNWHGYVCLAGNICLMMFYTTVAGWMLQYFVDTRSEERRVGKEGRSRVTPGESQEEASVMRESTQ